MTREADLSTRQLIGIVTHCGQEKGGARQVGDWRVIYKIEPPDVGLVVKIAPRREIYEG